MTKRMTKRTAERTMTTATAEVGAESSATMRKAALARCSCRRGC